VLLFGLIQPAKGLYPGASKQLPQLALSP
jgi:hypothetical protein